MNALYEYARISRRRDTYPTTQCMTSLIALPSSFPELSGLGTLVADFNQNQLL